MRQRPPSQVGVSWLAEEKTDSAHEYRLLSFPFSGQRLDFTHGPSIPSPDSEGPRPQRLTCLCAPTVTLGSWYIFGDCFLM